MGLTRKVVYREEESKIGIFGLENISVYHCP
jgi:hypothetical protein